MPNPLILSKLWAYLEWNIEMAISKRKAQIDKKPLIVGLVIFLVVIAIIAYGYSASQKNKELAAQAAAYEQAKQAKINQEKAEALKHEQELKSRVERQQQQWGKPSPEQLAKESKEKAELAERFKPIAIGMSESEVIKLGEWGIPDKKNTTTTANGATEQWVYKDNRYLYFENGRLRSIQENN